MEVTEVMRRGFRRSATWTLAGHRDAVIAVRNTANCAGAWKDFWPTWGRPPIPVSEYDAGGAPTWVAHFFARASLEEFREFCASAEAQVVAEAIWRLGRY